MTKGLACLCKWPLAYEKKVWDAMMEEASSVCHHWIAHVLPLYALLFPETCSDGTAFILKVRSIPLPQAAGKSMRAHLSGSDLRSCGASSDVGILRVVHGTCIPYVKSLQQEYRDRYAIDLAAALEKTMGAWILDWLHILGASAQLLCAASEPKISGCVPAWVQQSLRTILERYGPYADSMDLERFEAACRKRAWKIDAIILGSTAAVNDPSASGGDLVKLCTVEYINKVRRDVGTKTLSPDRLPPSYFVGLMDSVSDGMSLAIRLRSSGSVIRAPGEAGNKRRGQKRASAANDADDNDDNSPESKRPSYCDALDFGGMPLDDPPPTQHDPRESVESTDSDGSE